MNGANDGLSCVAEFTEESDNGVGGLTVEARSWFVQEKEQRGFCRFDRLAIVSWFTRIRAITYRAQHQS